MLDEKQLEERRHYLGGSDVAAALSRNPNKTALKLYYEKIDGAEQEDNPFLENGNDGEDKNRKKFAEITGLRVQIADSTKHHPQYPFLAANVDGLIFGDSKEQKKQDDESPIAILEVKCVGHYGRKNWGAPVVIPELNMDEKYQKPFNRYGFDKPDGEIPETYVYQALLYAAIYEIPVVYFAVDFGMDQYLCTYKYQRDLELEKLVIDKLVQFWNEHVKKYIPPDAKTYDDIKMLYPEVKPKTQIEATKEIEDLFLKAKIINNQINMLEFELDELKVKIADYTSDNNFLIDSNDKKIAKNTETKAKGKFDRARLLKENAEIHDKYWKLGDANKSTRSFKLLL